MLSDIFLIYVDFWALVKTVKMLLRLDPEIQISTNILYTQVNSTLLHSIPSVHEATR